MSKEYWICIIGPAERDEMEDGADLSMRMATQDGFERVTGKHAEHCWSGWGNDEKVKEHVLKAWCDGPLMPE